MASSERFYGDVVYKYGTRLYNKLPTAKTVKSLFERNSFTNLPILKGTITWEEVHD